VKTVKKRGCYLGDEGTTELDSRSRQENVAPQSTFASRKLVTEYTEGGAGK